MTILIDKLLLLTGCTMFMLHDIKETGVLQILSLLMTIIYTCCVSCCNLELRALSQLSLKRRYICIGLSAWFVLSVLPLTSIGYYLPFVLYEITVLFPSEFKKYTPVISPSSIPSISSYERRSDSQNFLLLLGCFLSILMFGFYTELRPELLVTLCLLAVCLSWKTRRLIYLEESLRLLRDDSTEYYLLSKQRHQALIEKQDYEIHVATLKERNRIAREIHDNVGHMLSRSLLQSGALMVLNKQEQLTEPLNALKDTLSSAMDSIRQSVHDLHDDSIDLKSSIEELLSQFSTYQIQFDYDMGSAVPAPVKYCFLSIIKEALSNIARHSQATKICIILREHPVIYQLTVSDNGTSKSPMDDYSPGIGILNMQERIRQLNGNFHITKKDGFRIFASIPISLNE
ncbi:MAG: sensor histidine kinase [Lachnospiraceae bacterium]|nr:sensor histidine kinase [Lachnospiraceae bacterium]